MRPSKYDNSVSKDKARFYQSKVKAVSCPTIQRVPDWCEGCTDNPGWPGYKAEPRKRWSRFRTRARADPVDRFQKCVGISGGDTTRITYSPIELDNNGEVIYIKVCVSPAINAKRNMIFQPPQGVSITDIVIPPMTACVDVGLRIGSGILGEVVIPYKLNGLNGRLVLRVETSYGIYEPVFRFEPNSVTEGFKGPVSLIINPSAPEFLNATITPPTSISITPLISDVPIDATAIQYVFTDLGDPTRTETTTYRIPVSYQSIGGEFSYTGTQLVDFTVSELWPVKEPNPLCTIPAVQTDIDPPRFGTTVVTSADGKLAFINKPWAAEIGLPRVGRIIVYEIDDTCWRRISVINCPNFSAPRDLSFFGYHMACSADGSYLYASFNVGFGGDYSFPVGGVAGGNWPATNTVPNQPAGVFVFRRVSSTEWQSSIDFIMPPPANACIRSDLTKLSTSADGVWLAVCTSGTIILGGILVPGSIGFIYKITQGDTPSWTLVQTIPGLPDSVCNIKITPDGKYVLWVDSIGKAFLVFERNNDTFSALSETSADFGSVSVNYYDCAITTDAGYIFICESSNLMIFKRSGNNWELFQTITTPVLVTSNPDPTVVRSTSNRVVCSEEGFILIVGNPEDPNLTDGKVEVYEKPREGLQWVLKTKIYPNGATGSGEMFGSTLSYTQDENFLLVGSPDFDTFKGRVTAFKSSS